MRKIRVGLIGASLGTGWASRSHIPALQALDEVELLAVATTRQESADAAAREYGIPRAYGRSDDLINDPDVDVVSVVVKVPGHYPLVESALAAGKHVFCEWPLGRNLAEAEALRELAQRSGVHHMVGLQARRGPVWSYARDLVAQGFVGRVLSCDFVGSSPDHSSPRVPQRRAWAVQRGMGQNLFAIKTGHTLDALAYCLDTGFAEVEGIVRALTERATVIETGEELEVTAPSQVLLAATLENGVIASVHLQGGTPRSSGFRFDIYGDQGTLQVTGTDGAQTSEMALRGASRDHDMAEMPVPERYLDALTRKLSGPVANVAREYRALAEGILASTPVGPDFGNAVSMHHLLEVIERASGSGQRQRLA